MLDPLSPLATLSQLPLQEALPRLRRVVAANGQCHLVLDERLLCSGAAADGEVDRAWCGTDAVALASCPDCRALGERLLESVDAEAAAVKERQGPLQALLSAHVEKKTLSSEEVARLEERSYLGFWLSLVGAALLASLGLYGFAVLWAAASSLLRLFWLFGRARFERSSTAAKP